MASMHRNRHAPELQAESDKNSSSRRRPISATRDHRHGQETVRTPPRSQCISIEFGLLLHLLVRSEIEPRSLASPPAPEDSLHNHATPRTCLAPHRSKPP